MLHSPVANPQQRGQVRGCSSHQLWLCCSQVCSHGFLHTSNTSSSTADDNQYSKPTSQTLVLQPGGRGKPDCIGWPCRTTNSLLNNQKRAGCVEGCAFKYQVSVASQICDCTVAGSMGVLPSTSYDCSSYRN